MERKGVTVLAAILTIALALSQLVSAQNRTIGIGIVLNTNPTAAVLSNLRRYGTVLNVIPDVRSLTFRARVDQLEDDPRSSLRRRGHSRQRTAGKADRRGMAHRL